MPQAMLIDINTAAITHRNGVISGITDRNYSKVIRHLYCYNAALPKEYQITVDSEEYNQKVRLNTVALCGNCTTVQTINDKEIELPTEIDHDKVKIIKLLLPANERLLSGKTHDYVWVCPKCFKDNKRSETKFIKSVLKEPYFLRCVPSPPSRTTGIVDRTTYDSKFEQWAGTFLTELEQAAAKFRQEYKPKDQSDIMEGDLDLSADEFD